MCIRDSANRLHVHTTIDLDNLTTYVARHIRSEEKTNVSDILCLTTTAQRNLDVYKRQAEYLGNPSGEPILRLRKGIPYP